MGTERRTLRVTTVHLLDAAPIAATAFAIPQFVPQLIKLGRTKDSAGVSWSWAALTSVNNAAWSAYFALSHYWTALFPSSSATVLSAALAIMLGIRRRSSVKAVAVIVWWGASLAAGYLVGGRTALGDLLIGAFVLQVTPSIWTAYGTDRPTGVSTGTWRLILCELSCWTVFGIHMADARLTVLGVTGVIASMLMLARVRRTRILAPAANSERRTEPAHRDFTSTT